MALFHILIPLEMPLYAQETVQELSLSEAELLEQIIEVHPSLEALDQQIAAIHAAEKASTAWKDPIFSLAYSNMPILKPWPGNHAMSGIELGIAQKIPFLNKNAAKISYIRSLREKFFPAKENLTAQIKVKTSILFIEAQAIEANLKLQNKLQNLLNLWLQKSEILLVKKSNQQTNILRIHLLLLKNKEAIYDLSNKLQIIKSKLNILREQKPETLFTIKYTEKNYEDYAEFNDQKVKSAQMHPLLRVLDAQKQEKTAQLKSLNVQKWPDVTLKLSYRQRTATMSDPGNNFFSAGVSIPIPSFSLNSKNHLIRKEEYALKAIEAQKTQLYREIQTQIQDLKLKKKRLLDKLKIYDKEIIPQAAVIYDNSLNSYSNAQTSFEQVLMSYKELIKLDQKKIDLYKEFRLIENNLNYWSQSYAQN